MTTAGKCQEGGILPLFASLLMMKVLGKGVKKAGKRYMDNNF